MSESPAPAPIDYAPPSRRWGWWKKYLAIAIIFILALAIAWKWATIQRFYATTQAWLWQRRAMNHALPPGTVVYADDPAEIANLKQDGRYFEAGADGPMIYNPAALREMEQWKPSAQGSSARFLPSSWGGIFLHSRTAAGGSTRLVAIGLIPFSGQRAGGSKAVIFFGATIRPGNPLHPWELAKPPGSLAYIPLGANDHFTCFAGQIDPSDASHFTIDFIRASRRGTIDGRLQRDDTIALSVRGGVIKSGLNTTPVLIWPAPPSTAP